MQYKATSNVWPCHFDVVLARGSIGYNYKAVKATCIKYTHSYTSDQSYSKCNAWFVCLGKRIYAANHNFHVSNNITVRNAMYFISRQKRLYWSIALAPKCTGSINHISRPSLHSEQLPW
jgi:hypothetical protein